MLPRSLRPSRNELFEKFEKMLIEKAEWALAQHGKGKGVDHEQGRLAILRINLAMIKSSRKLSPVQLRKLRELSNLAEEIIRTVDFIERFRDLDKPKAE